MVASHPRGARRLADRAELEQEFEYTIESDDGTDNAHLYFADKIDLDHPAFVRFDPLYELAEGIDRRVGGETVVIPYIRVLRITKRKEPD